MCQIIFFILGGETARDLLCLELRIGLNLYKTGHYPNIKLALGGISYRRVPLAEQYLKMDLSLSNL
jgi:hypothetical protein